jgi:hypothetical protein
MQGCTSWPGILLNQDVFRQEHSVIAQVAELRLTSVRGLADDIMRQRFVDAFPDIRTIDLRVQESSETNPTPVTTNPNIIPNAAQSEEAEAEEKLNQMRVRFQHNGTDIIKTKFGNMATGNCSGSSSSGYSTLSYHIVEKLEILLVQIELSQNFGYSDIPVCTKYPEGTNITIQNFVGVADSDVDRDWLAMIKSSSYSGQVDTLTKCSPSCTRPLNYDENGEGAYVVDVFIAGQPNPVVPYSKNFIVQVPNSGRSHRSEVVITGDFELPGGLSVSLPTHMPLMALRDPPGGGSYSYYNAVKSTIRVTMKNYESYVNVNAGKCGVASMQYLGMA